MSYRALLLCVAATVNAPAVKADAAAPGFKADIVPVLRTRCAICHMTGQEAGNMALHPAAAYASLVSVPSVEVPSMMRVAPGAPDKSYLMLKLEGTHLDAGGSGARMPFQQAPLDEGTLGKIRAWILAGARND